MMALEITDMGLSFVTRDHMSQLDTVDKHRQIFLKGSLELKYPKNDFDFRYIRLQEISHATASSSSNSYAVGTCNRGGILS